MALCIAVGGCAGKRTGYDVPQVPMPAQYRNQPPVPAPPQGADAAPPTDVRSAADAPVPVAAARSRSDEFSDWWRVFGSAELSALVDRAMTNNPDVRIATLRIAQAKARADQARAGLAPTITAPLGSSIQAPGGPVGDVPVGSNDRSTTQKLYQASLRANWRIDLWGEQTSLAESANLQLWQAAFDRDNVQRNVLANVATSYVEYLSLNDRLKIATEAERVLGGILTTIEKRVEAGDATLIDLEQQKAAIFAVRATIPSLEQQREDALASIASLVGSVPGAVKLTDAGLETMRLPSTGIPPLPSSLLLRRPDIRMVEARLLAADADIDVARARLLPPLDLSAQAGYSSLAMSRLFQPLSFFWNALASLTVSIFDGGSARSEKEKAQAVHEEMLETYARAIFQAVREVEGALATVRLSAKRLDAQQEAAASARRAWLSSAEVYAVGGLDYPALLDAERTYHRYADELERIRMDRYRGFISLFQALGGGVEFGEQIPGKGQRPQAVAAGVSAGTVSGAPATPSLQGPVAVYADGMDWLGGQAADGGSGWQIENFWQVELPGLYHRSTIGAAWRDLRARYPAMMENRVVRPRLHGRLEDSADGQVAWYRLYVGKFATPELASAFCRALQEGFQRCRVISSRSDDTVPLSPADPTPAGTAVGSSGRPQAPVDPARRGSDASPAKVGSEASPTPVLDPTPPPQSPAPDRPEPPRAAALASAPGAAPAPAPTRREAELGVQAYTVQLGAFSNLENAAIAHAVWQFREQPVYVAEIRDGDGRARYAVRTGVFAQRREAAEVAAMLRRKEDAPAVVVPTLLDKSGKPEALTPEELDLQHPRAQSPVVPEPPEAPVAIAAPDSRAPGANAGAGGVRSVYAVQLGAFSSRENAAVAVAFWRGRDIAAYVVEIRDAEDRSWYAVRTGAFPVRRNASALALALGRKEDAPAVVVRTPAGRTGVPLALDLERLAPADQPESRDSRPALRKAGSASKVETKIGRRARTAASARPMPVYAVQLDAFSSLENAVRSLSNWRAKGYDAYVSEILDGDRKTLYAVRAGAFAQRREAAGLVRTLVRNENFRAMLVPAIVDGSGKLAVVDVGSASGGAR